MKRKIIRLLRNPVVRIALVTLLTALLTQLGIQLDPALGRTLSDALGAIAAVV